MTCDQNPNWVKKSSDFTNPFVCGPAGGKVNVVDVDAAWNFFALPASEAGAAAVSVNSQPSLPHQAKACGKISL